MAKKEYTHAKGFNVTSLLGIHGLYILHDSSGEVNYIGKCNDDFKSRISSHCNRTHGKLNDNIKYLRVIAVDQDIHPLHVLENLLIWYLKPIENKDPWFFNKALKEKEVKQIANERGLKITGRLKEFILSYDTILIEREWEDEQNYKRYGSVETIDSNRITCSGTEICLCFNCLVNSGFK